MKDAVTILIGASHECFAFPSRATELSSVGVLSKGDITKNAQFTYRNKLCPRIQRRLSPRIYTDLAAYHVSSNTQPARLDPSP